MATEATTGTQTLNAAGHQFQINLAAVTKLKILSYDYVSSAGGQVLATIDGLDGYIERVVFVPGTGDDAPSANSDWILKDQYGIDALAGDGENRSATLTQSVTAYQTRNDTDHSFPNVGTMTVTGSAVGAANGMTLHIYVRE